VSDEEGIKQVLREKISDSIYAMSLYLQTIDDIRVRADLKLSKAYLDEALWALDSSTPTDKSV
jgi:hypothetical protein